MLGQMQVKFTLHPSFEQPERVVTAPPFEVTETGWGEFEIAITVRSSLISLLATRPRSMSDMSHMSMRRSLRSTLTQWRERWSYCTSCVCTQTMSRSQRRAQRTHNRHSNHATRAPCRMQIQVVSEEVEEVVFSEPTEQFYYRMAAHQPVRAPPSQVMDLPLHTASLSGSRVYNADR